MQDSVDIERLGLDPSQPLYDLNLAGAQGVPTPGALTRHAPGESHAPDFIAPDLRVPTLQAHDLTVPSVMLVPEFSADPLLPDVRDFQHPYAVTIVNQDGLVPDAQLAADVPTPDEIAASLYPGLGFDELAVRHGVEDADPPVPDLQQLELLPQSSMASDERPGELAPSALEALHASGSYQQVADHEYPASQMDQRGVNSWRARHLSLLDYGLEERS